MTSPDGPPVEHERRHAPFAEGNGHALVHGARSPRTVSAVAETIKAEMRAGPDWPAQLDEPRFAHAVDAYVDAVAIARLLRAQLDRESVEDWIADTTESTSTTEQVSESTSRTRSQGRRRTSVLAQVERAETRAAKLRAELGLTPGSEAKLERNVVVAAATRQSQLEAIRAAGRDTVTARAERVREIPAPPDEPAELVDDDEGGVAS